jgi:MFS family permease
MFVGAMDQTMVATALPAIAGELGEVERVSWIIVAYLIAATIAAPVYGRLGDVFGRQRMLLVALGVHAAGALTCSLAPSLAALVGARVLQGFGGGGLIALAVALIGEQLPPRERGRFQAWIAACFIAASGFGPVAGGLLTQGFGWRAVFLAAPPLGLLAAWLAATRLAAERPEAPQGFRFDWAGTLLFGLFVAAALLALDRLQRLSLAALPGLAALAGLALLALWLLVRAERRAPDPLLPLGLLGDPVIWRTTGVAALVGGALVGLITFLPVYLQVVRGLAPGAVGLTLLPMTVSGGFGAMFAGRMMTRTGQAMLWPSIGLPVAALALAVVALGAGTMPVGVLPWLLGVAAVGFGTSFPVVQTVVQVAAGRRRLGIAAASVQFSRSLGAAAGTAALGTLLFAMLAASGGEAAGLFRRLLGEGAAAVAALDPAALAALRADLAGAFQAAFGLAAAMAAAAAVLCWRVPLRRV